MLEALYEDHKARGMLLVVMLSGGDETMLEQWASDYTFPVLLDADGSVQARWDRDSAAPSTHLVAPGVKLVVQDESIDLNQIETHLPR